MKSGVLPVKKDHRNFSALSFGAVLDFPLEFNVDAGLSVPNQNTDGYPNGCTGYSQSELCQDEDKKKYKPDFTYKKTLTMADLPDNSPCDMKTSLKSTIVFGVEGEGETEEQAYTHRRGAYYQIENHSDWFDAVRSAMTVNNCSVSVASPWYSSFENIGADGIIHKAEGNFTLHNWKVCGWKTIYGVPYLIGKSWQGENFGDKGFCYFPREIINQLLSTKGAGAFILAPYDPSKVQTVKLSIMEVIASFLRMWFNKITKEPIVVSAPIIPPPVPLKLTPEIAPIAPKYLWDTDDEIRHSIRVIGDEEGLIVLQKDLACDIASCESGNKERRFNIKIRGIADPRDRGLFQWNSKYHPEITDEIAFDPEKNARLGCKAIKAGKAHVYWSASEFCWNRTGKYNSLLT